MISWLFTLKFIYCPYLYDNFVVSLWYEGQKFMRSFGCSLYHQLNTRCAFIVFRLTRFVNLRWKSPLCIVKDGELALHSVFYCSSSKGKLTFLFHYAWLSNYRVHTVCIILESLIELSHVSHYIYHILKFVVFVVLIKF